jgi:hypothetical protein
VAIIACAWLGCGRLGLDHGVVADAASDADAGGDAIASMPPPMCSGSAECSCASFGGHDYRFCTTLRIWSDAETQCTNAGMQLARVDAADENAWIRVTADTLTTAFVWLGAEDPSQTSHWQWADGTLFWVGTTAGAPVGGLYTNWLALHPTGNAVRSCGGMRPTIDNAQWADVSCTSTVAYVCKL